MKRRLLMLVLCALIMLASGCATIATGKFQNVPITSDPPGAKVRADTGESTTTPGGLLLYRNKSYNLTAEYPGSEPQQAQLKNKVQGWFWGNILLGGIVGGIVDIASGSCDELLPKKVHFDFTSAGQEMAKRKLSYLEDHPFTDENVRFAILNELATKGMTPDELIASFGDPSRVDIEKGYEIYVYDNRTPKSYYFKKGVLEKTL